MYTLGINAVYYDTAACLLKDGQVIAAAEDERFTHVKHGKRPVPFSTYELPFNAIHYCLQEANITLAEVDHAAYSYDPYLLLGGHRDDATLQLPLEPSAHPKPEEWESTWEPLFLSYVVNAPRYLADGAPHHLQARFRGARVDGKFRMAWREDSDLYFTLLERAGRARFVRARRAGGAPRAPGRVGREHRPAAQEPFQRAAV